MDLSASREGLRAYARGRAYDPNRYPVTPYWDPNGPAKPEKPAGEEEKAGPLPSPAGAQTGEQKAKEAQAPAPSEESGDYEEAYAGDGEET